MRKVYKIGPFLLDPDARALAHEGATVALGARGVAVLTALVSRANEYVEKSAILDAAWPGLVVEEANLAVQISAIRRALSGVPGGEKWIETLARRGYRFVGPVVESVGQRVTPIARDRKRTNLPELLTSFVGRERELAEIKQLLPGTRLLTLSGTGGIGKTRLAQQAAAEVLDAYRDGIWFIDFAPSRDPTLVPSALAQVLQVKEAAGQPLITLLCNHLRTRETVLILDNCEHVLDACARLTETLLRETARVSLIATSREPLHLACERVYPLGTLPLADPKTDVQSIARSDAVQLFLERARQYRPRFDLQEHRAQAVAEICVRLDGIPLALELAAARVAVLPVEQIVHLLEQRFRLLTSGNRELPRHQTLRALIDWSYELLDAAEKALFARQSVFAGGWTLAAAEAVCGGEPFGRDEVVYVLIGLIEQSLVVVDEDGDRYRMLETVREYAKEKLVESGDADAVRERHFGYCLALVECAGPAMLGGTQQKQTLDLLEADHDNLRSALSWALETPERAELGIRMCGTLYRFWIYRGYWQEGYTWCTKALAQAPTSGDTAARARALLAAGSTGQKLTDTRPLLEEALRLSREARDRHTEAATLNNLAWLLVSSDELATAQTLLEQARVINRELGNASWELINVEVLTQLACRQGNYSAALESAEEGLARSRSMGNRGLEASFLNLLAVVARARNDVAAAQAFNEHSLEIFRELRMPLGQADNLSELATLAVMRGDTSLASSHATEALDIYRKLGESRDLALCLAVTGALALQVHQYVVAARFWGAAAALRGSSLPAEPWHRECITSWRTRCRQALAGAAYDAAYVAGRTLSLEAATDEALEWLAHAPSKKVELYRLDKQ